MAVAVVDERRSRRRCPTSLAELWAVYVECFAGTFTGWKRLDPL
jgi:hypothetical protein